jgi:hypothetical protein
MAKPCGHYDVGTAYAERGGTITYDQPSTVTSILTAPLSINKNVTIAGLNGMSKPLVSVDFTSLGLDPGITIEDGKNVNFKDVDFNAVNNTNIPKNEIIIIENNAILSIKGSTGINDN